MTTLYNIYSHKGGVGVTTTACAIALYHARGGNNVLLADNTETPDTYAWLGMPNPKNKGLREQSPESTLDVVHRGVSVPLFASHYAEQYEYIVCDNGRATGLVEPSTDMNVVNICVVRNEYMALRNAVNAGFVDTDHDFMLFMHGEGALTQRDITQVLGREPLGVTHIDPKVQRAIDAGVCTFRVDTLFTFAQDIINTVKERVAK